MTIINKNNHKYRQNRKGFHNGKASVTDQITCGAGQTSTGRSHRRTRSILAPLFTSRFYTGTNLRNTRAAAVLSDRLPRNSRSAGGFIGSAKRHFTKQAATLYHLAEGAAQAFKKNVFQGLLAKIFDNAWRLCFSIDSKAFIVFIVISQSPYGLLGLSGAISVHHQSVWLPD